MATVQDRGNISRVALEKWTKREQLCLASAVSCSGDQNWMTVSRSLKGLCGAQHPPDWFSQKLCAVKYGELLENVETPKRKKRTTSDNASNVVETPTDLILRRLTEERIQELKSEIREQQETYAKLYTDVVHLQTGNYNEEQIRAMWMEIEREQELDRQQKARKQMGAMDITRNVRLAQMQQQKQQIPSAAIKQEQDMDIDETCKPQGTSPLLSSLLKSSSPSPQAVTTPTTSTARVSAPTITNLLTGGTVSSPSASSSSASSPAHSGTLLLPSLPLSKPLTGPVPLDSSQTPSTVLSPSQSAPTLSMLLEKSKPAKESFHQQSLGPSTSQQAEAEIKIEPSNDPNVEMLPLVKEEEVAVMEDEPMEDGALTPTKEEEQQLMEVLKNFMPDSIDELADILTSNNGILNPGILEEESILEDTMLEDVSLMDEAQDVDDQLEVKLAEGESTQDSKNPPPLEEDSGAKIKTKQSTETESVDLQSLSQPEATAEAEATGENTDAEPTAEATEGTSEQTVEEKIETISSDDSSDNVPLASHAKDAKALTAATAPPAENEDPNSKPATPLNAKQSPIDPVLDEAGKHDEAEEMFEKDSEPAPPKEDEEPAALNEDNGSPKMDQNEAAIRKGSLSDSSDVIIIPTDDESNDAKSGPEAKKAQEATDSMADAFNKDEEAKSMDEAPQTSAELGSRESPFQQDQNITSICLPDTDDDSSTFEAPSATPKDDKANSQKQQTQGKKTDAETRAEDDSKQTLTLRKLRDRDRSESPLVEDDASDHSVTVRSRRRYSSTPVMDSIPNSPASSDDREIKVWKKSLMTVYNNLLTNKNASIFLRPFTEEQHPQYKQVCQRPMDLQIIKRHIETGTIRNMTDLQRDVFLMCQNAIMAFKKNSSYANMARDLIHEFVQLKEQIVDAKMEKAFSSSSSSYTPGVKVRGSARKSQRLP